MYYSTRSPPVGRKRKWFAVDAAYETLGQHKPVQQSYLLPIRHATTVTWHVTTPTAVAAPTPPVAAGRESRGTVAADTSTGCHKLCCVVDRNRRVFALELHESEATTRVTPRRPPGRVPEMEAGLFSPRYAADLRPFSGQPLQPSSPLFSPLTHCERVLVLIIDNWVCWGYDVDLRTSCTVVS